jgi:drug/metabolite transporter (DMT)-like permease
VGLGWGAATGTLGELTRVPWSVHLFGIAGLFGYHLLYFSALRLAPAAEAGLIAYLWPLFIVLGSGLLPGERLRRGHLGGGALAFGGAALIVLGRGGEGGAAVNAPLGFALAFGCALTWAAYSVGSRRPGPMAHRGGDGLLPWHGALVGAGASGLGGDGLAGLRGGLGGGRGAGARARGARLLRLGCWG